MRCYADQQAGQQFAQDESRSDSKNAAQNDQPRRLHYDQSKHTAPRRPKSEADAHLLRALGNRVGENPVDADCGKNHSKHGKAGNERHGQSPLRNGGRHTLVHRLNIEQRLLRVYGS